MVIKFNDFNSNYKNYNLVVGHQNVKDAEKSKESKEIEKSSTEFKGLENETDLLTKSTQSLYGVKLGKFTAEDKDLADETNAILADLGYTYKVTAAQVASVTNGLKTVVIPGLESVTDSAVAARIQDPKGPFADLFI